MSHKKHLSGASVVHVWRAVICQAALVSCLCRLWTTIAKEEDVAEVLRRSDADDAVQEKCEVRDAGSPTTFVRELSRSN